MRLQSHAHLGSNSIVITFVGSWANNLVFLNLKCLICKMGLCSYPYMQNHHLLYSGQHTSPKMTTR